MPIRTIVHGIVPLIGAAAWDQGAAAGGDSPRKRKPPRLAVLIIPADAQHARPDLRRALRARYGIDQLQYATLAPGEWTALVEGQTDVPGVERMRGRLALARLGKAHLVAVVGCAAPGYVAHERTPRSWADVRHLARRIRSWNIAAQVIGIWSGDNSSGSAVALAPGSTRPNASEHVGGQYNHCLAARRWEDDGGRSGPATVPCPNNPRRTPWRQRRVAPEHRVVPEQPGTRERERRGDFGHRGISRLRPGVARLATR